MKTGTINHPKMHALAHGLGITRRDAVGLLEMLWEFTAKYAPQGDVGKHPDFAIAAAVDWPENPEVLVRGLVEAKWLDSCTDHRLVVHDWKEHAPEYVRKSLGRKHLDFVQTTADNGCQNPYMARP